MFEQASDLTSLFELISGRTRARSFALHSFGGPSGLPAVPLPLPLLELSLQLERQSSERVKFEEASVEQVEAGIVKPEESKVKKCPGLAQELQVKKRRPLPLAVKKSQLLGKIPDEYQSSQVRNSSCASCSSRRKMFVSTSASTVSERSCSTAASRHSVTLLKASCHCWVALAACAQHAVFR